MTLINIKPPPRPENVTFTSISELYQHYENIFLSEGRDSIISPCGHNILVFDHHFWHLAAVTIPGKDKPFMKEEKATIRATIEGFAHYVIGENGSRAKNLRSAYATLTHPDEVWEDNPKTQSRWVYVKEYAHVPYPFSIALVTIREEEGITIPKTSFPCKKGDVKKWRNGKKIFP